MFLRYQKRQAVVHRRHLYMRRVEPHQRRFSQKTVQVTARRLIRDWDFGFFPNSIAVGTRKLQQCFLDRGRFSSRLSIRGPAARGTRVYERAVAAGGVLPLSEMKM